MPLGPLAAASPTAVLSLCRRLFTLLLEAANVRTNTRRCSYGGQDGALNEGHSRWEDVAVGCSWVAVCNVIGQEQSRSEAGVALVTHVRPRLCV